jgi:hypothetical protein
MYCQEKRGGDGDWMDDHRSHLRMNDELKLVNLSYLMLVSDRGTETVFFSRSQLF